MSHEVPFSAHATACGHGVQEVMGILTTAYDISGLAAAAVDAEVRADHSVFQLDLWQLQRELVFGTASSRGDSRRARWMGSDGDPGDGGCGRDSSYTPVQPPPARR